MRSGGEARRGSHCGALEPARKAKQRRWRSFNRQANEVSKTIGKAKDAAEREARKEEGRKLRELCTKAQAEYDKMDAEAEAISSDDSEFDSSRCADRRRRRMGTGKCAREARPRRLEFKPLDHVQIAERLGMIDFEAGRKEAGHGFYFLKNDAVLLELALQRYAVEMLMRRRVHADDDAGFGPE